MNYMHFNRLWMKSTAGPNSSATFRLLQQKQFIFNTEVAVASEIPGDWQPAGALQ
jgi:hypothetical protein